VASSRCFDGEPHLWVTGDKNALGRPFQNNVAIADSSSGRSETGLYPTVLDELQRGVDVKL